MGEKLRMGTLNCDSCKDLGTCTKACYMHLGKAMVDFIEHIDVVETRIGETESRKAKGPVDLIVAGHQIYKDEVPGWILKDISTILDKSDKFNMAYEMTAFQIAKKYCENTGKTTEETFEIVEKIRQINKNKLFIVPFKPNTVCSIEYDDGETVAKNTEAQISSVKWNNNAETHKFEAVLYFEVDNMPKKSQQYSISDYLSKFSLTQIDMHTRASKVDKKIIKVDNNGIISPIVIKYGVNQIAIDGSYVYMVKPQETYIIGVWGAGDKLLIDNSIKNDAIDKIRNNENFIRCHKRYIAPYMLYEPNVIQL